jgi:hypothetical protein
VAPGCNECNEALKVAVGTIQAARRLALVAENALSNGDLQRARSALGGLHEATAATDRARAHRLRKA